VIVLFVDISGVVDHHCLNFIFINVNIAYSVDVEFTNGSKEDSSTAGQG
jgi:hypothetical protein